MESWKPDCSGALQRKTLQSSPTPFSSALSPVRFYGKNSEIAPISCNFQRNPRGFLCTSDCVAEQEGLEPSVRFLELNFERSIRNVIECDGGIATAGINLDAAFGWCQC
jgi:hypothetical protein